MGECQQNLRGRWTKEKLELISKYLGAYSTIMNQQSFNYAYIDAFAGTGYLYQKIDSEQQTFLSKEFGFEEIEFLNGSARMALCIKPSFKKYIFIEKSKSRCKDLHRLKNEFTELSNKIEIVQEEANSHLIKICKKNWQKHRAVIFLDPYGMQVKWSTVEAIAATKAIDLWLLFPLGQAVNRLLKKDGKINNINRKRLA